MHMHGFIDRRAARRAPIPGVLAFCAALAAAAPVHARPAPASFADAAAKVRPAVVNVSTLGKPGPDRTARMPGRRGGPFADRRFRDFMERFFGDDMPRFEDRAPAPPNGRARGLGSGFLIDADGHVVTSDHVVAGAGGIRVRLQDGAEFEARLVGSDPKTDLALLKIEAGRPLPFLRLGDSDRIRAGDWVFAIGNPFGLGGTVTAGIVSARGRDLPGGALVDFLQIDAPINRGNSGGPAFNAGGEVIGVNTAIFSPNGGNVGIGFAVPSNTVGEVVASLRADGAVERGWLGVRVQKVTPELAEGLGLDAASGALVAWVEDDGPAAAAGIEAGDVIVSWNGETVDDLRLLPRMVAATPVGEAVEVGLLRGGEARTVSVETGRMPAPRRTAAAEPGALAGTGVVVADADAARRSGVGAGRAREGAVVRRVAPGSSGAAAGLRRGDVIVRVARTEIRDATGAVEAVAELRRDGGRTVTLLIDRRGARRFVALRLAGA